MTPASSVTTPSPARQQRPQTARRSAGSARALLGAREFTIGLVVVLRPSGSTMTPPTASWSTAPAGRSRPPPSP